MTRWRAVLLSLLVFGVLSTPVIATWRGLRQAGRHAAEEQTHLVADQAARRLEDFTKSRMLILEAVRKDLQAGLLSERTAFLSLTKNFQEEFGGFQAINWIDGDGVIRWVSPLATNEGAAGRSVLEHPVAGPVLRAVQETRQPHMTPPLELFQGGRGFTTYYPVLGSDGRPASYVNGVFRIDTLVRGALQEGVLDRYDLMITDGGTLVFGSAADVAQGVEDRVSGESTVELLSRRWRMKLTPQPTAWDSMRGDSHLFFLAGGLALAAALVLMLFAGLLHHIQQREAEEQRQVLEAQFQQARKMEAIGQLAGGVAHDFNNLLTAILTNVSLVRRTGVGEGTKPGVYLERISDACERAAELTAQLLTFSRKQVVEEAFLNLAEEIERQRTLFAPIVRDDVRLQSRLDPATGVVRINPGHLSQVLMNLLGNAVDAMPRGGELELSTRAETRSPRGEPGRWAVLGVRDHGIGMSDEVLTRVLEPFFTTKSVGKGTGLGLATVYGIATNAGGFVEIESSPGVGTTVEVWLPRVRHRIEPPAEPDAPPGVRLTGTVLLVEDEETVRLPTARLLRDAGLDVLEAAHGRDALDLVREGAKFDVVLTDAVMPHVGGLDLLRNLRKSGDDVGAVIFSGYSAHLSQADLKEVNAVFVAKPYSESTLLDAIEGRLRAKERRDRGAADGQAPVGRTP